MQSSAPPQTFVQSQLLVANAASSRGVLIRRYGVPVLLFVATVLTTLAIGARFMDNFEHHRAAINLDSDLWPWLWIAHQPGRLVQGWPFSVALLTILLAHEFGHYIACRCHGIPCTLPLLMPAPTLSGTAGAVILLRGPIPNRRALVDVGVYGPIAGYIASLVVVAIGLLLSPAMQPQTPQLVRFGEPLTISLLDSILRLFRPDLPTFGASLHHPVLLSGWVGLFITALNLIPAGQLDGGHLLYAVTSRTHRPVTWMVAGLLAVLGVFFWIGWILWGALMLLPAMRHPRVVDHQALLPARIALIVGALMLLALTFTPAPFSDSSLLAYLNWP